MNHAPFPHTAMETERILAISDMKNAMAIKRKKAEKAKAVCWKKHKKRKKAVTKIIKEKPHGYIW